MNKTLSIALAGFSFIIDEMAYIKLCDYLNALRNSLDASEADEVMHDIEIRMVEIFKELLGKREVINDSDVERVIAQIGTPEKIEEQEESYFSEEKQNRSKNSSENSQNRSSQKQLFRDPERQKIAGVCAGLAAYFGMDVSWMRLIWVIAFFLFLKLPGSPVLIYIILWVVLPKAETASDFLKMKGKPINFDNLKEESGKIVQFANETTSKIGETYHENRQRINSLVDIILNILKYCFAIILAFVAAGCFIGIFTMMIAYGSNKFGIDNNLGFYLEENNLSYLLLTIAALPTIILGIGALLLSIKLFSPKTKFNYVGRVLGILGIIWIILVGIFAVSASKFDFIYNGENEDYENVSIVATNDTIYLDSKKVNIPENFESYFNNIYSDKKTIFKRDLADVEITRKNNVKTPYLIVKKEADGYNQPLKMKVPLDVQGNRIIFPNYFEYPYQHRFRNYRLNYELVVPLETKIINEKENEILIHKDGFDDDYQENIKIDGKKISINGKKIEFDKNGNDDLSIDGKKVSAAQAVKILDSIGSELDNLKNVDIRIQDGKKKNSIKSE